MNRFLIAFVAGAVGFYWLPHLPEASWLLVLLVAFVSWRYVRLRWFSGLLGGYLWSFLHAGLQLSAALPQELEGKELILVGAVSSIPVQQGKVTRFEVTVASLSPKETGLAAPKRVRLSWYHSDLVLVPGEVWRFKVRLKRPRGFQNPGGFDYERWLFSHGIGATGYVKDWSGNQKAAMAYQGGWLDRQRQRIAIEISQRVPEPDAAALIRALGIGDRSGLSDTAWKRFTRTGTNHLVAISGLHIGMVAGLAFLLGQWFWRRSQWLTLKLPAMRAGAWLALVAALGYAALAGFSLPTQRALIMLGLGLGAVLLGRTLSLSRSFSLALFGVVLIDPMAPLASGFWLSFGAVAVILFAVNGRLSLPRGWRQWGRVQWVVALGLAPLLFMLFNQTSLIAPLVNLVLVPWFSLVLVPLVLLAVTTLQLPLPHDLLLNFSASLAELTLELLSWASQSPYALIQRPDLPVWIWLTGLAGVLLLLMPRGMPGRPLGLLLVAPMLLNSPERPRQGEVLFTLLDVGQGLSCVVETAAHVLVYDTGPAYASGFNTAEAVLLPYLRSRGIARIDQLIVSNADRDHAGGVEVLRHELEITRIMAGEALGLPQVEHCQAGAGWQWDGINFRILHPNPQDRFGNSNNASCVLQVEGVAGKLLIPGDVEREAEHLLVERYRQALRADILVAPHHGSNTSSSLAFIERVQPDFVLFPTGYRNRFGFPKPAVAERWRNTGASLHNTAEAGAIQFWLRPDHAELAPALYRENNPASWISAHTRQ